MNWNTNITEMGTLQIYNGTALYWEIEGCLNYTEEQVKTVLDEMIQSLEEILKNDN